ncbi:MAG: hypothetical protein M0Z28_09570 [Rhodospirillales bacterium]|nr:hypothetical protein [Rhodospirillales bacterium]
MTTAISPLPMQRFTDNNGNPLSGGKLFVYLAGTTTKTTTYTDSTGSTPNTNPVILNTRGEASVWLTPGANVKFVLSPSTDTDPPTNPIWTVDNIAPADGISAAMLPVVEASTTADALTAMGAAPSKDPTITGSIALTDAAGNSRNLFYETSGVQRWSATTDSTAEGGSNAGSNFLIARFSDAGTFIDNPVYITRSTGVAEFSQPPVVPDATASGNPVNLGQFAASTGAAGYQTWPTGVLEQWGAVTKGASASQVVTFSRAFPTACWGVVLSDNPAAACGYVQRVNSLSTTGFTITADVFASGSNPNTTVYWRAIGN